MAESMVVSGLVSKRAEVAGQIASFKTEIIRLRGALTHLDGRINRILTAVARCALGACPQIRRDADVLPANE